MSHFPFRFGSYARLSFFVLALSLVTLFALEDAPPVQNAAVLSPSIESQLKARANSLLVSLLGQGSFEVHLSVETKDVKKEVKEFTPTESVVESEQVKRERMKKGSQAQTKAARSSEHDYDYEVSSRNWIVGTRSLVKVTTQTRIASIRCIVLVDDEGAAAKSKKALECLLGADLERGDEIVFILR